jgi:2-oxoglutarate dehydrogenase E2 component (dihydrolipoamide succinyltransferase)
MPPGADPQRENILNRVRMISIKVPPLGESIVEATISRWLKNEGDAVAGGETLVELETDKITVEVPALKGGVLKRRLKNEGDVVKVDELLGELDETAVPAAAGAGQKPDKPASAASAGAPAESAKAPAASAAPTAAKGDQTVSPQAPARDGDVRSSPAARRVAAEEGVDIAAVSGTGRGGVVSKPDVIGAAGSREKAAPAAQAPSGAPPRPQAAPSGAPATNGARETREKMSTRRKRIAEHLLESQHSTAHLTTFNEVDMTAVMQLRDRLKERVEKEYSVKLTFMPFFIEAACQALAAYPVVNAQVDGDSIIYKHYVNMGIAVASEQGLIVPNIKNADSKGMLEVSRELAAVAKRARDGKLTMDDLTGGTFTITNGGVFGSLVSTPIINYPQVGILGLHKIQERPVAIAGKVEIRPMMYIALSYDHRIVDGQQAVLFLVRIKELLEEPASMLVT